MTPLTLSAAAPGVPAADAAKHRKLVDAAQQFEAMFLQEMLKPMNSLGASDGASDDDGSGAGGQNSTLTQFGTESVAKAIAKAGGLGIGRHIVAEVEQEHARHEARKNLEPALMVSHAAPIESVRR